ncbi:MAG: hypothetical protein IPM24_19470 [Bryobacterales bacterium]|nr:hypothetical protein [Bryobacterales bacterium]
MRSRFRVAGQKAEAWWLNLPAAYWSPQAGQAVGGGDASGGSITSAGQAAGLAREALDRLTGRCKEILPVGKLREHIDKVRFIDATRA